jgi:2-hydroxy-3-oxopropionate reductase
MNQTKQKIGFIGLGIMGRPMALNLLRAGYPLFVFARRAAAAQPLVDAGASVCDSLPTLAARADVIIVMVSDTPDVEQVLLGEHGVIEGVRPGSVVIDMSTISPTVTRMIAGELGGRGVDMLDAPVSGGEVGAIDATLSIMVGGKAEVLARVKPVLDLLGKNIVHVGDHGAGQVAKACNNLVIAVTLEGIAEAFTFARRNQVDVAKVREALLGGFAASKALDVHGKRMLEQNFAPGFKSRLHQKDLNIVLEEADRIGLRLPAAELLVRRLNVLVDSGDGDLDSSAIVKLIDPQRETGKS